MQDVIPQRFRSLEVYDVRQLHPSETITNGCGYNIKIVIALCYWWHFREIGIEDVCCNSLLDNYRITVRLKTLGLDVRSHRISKIHGLEWEIFTVQSFFTLFQQYSFYDLRSRSDKSSGQPVSYSPHCAQCRLACPCIVTSVCVVLCNATWNRMTELTTRF